LSGGGGRGQRRKDCRAVWGVRGYGGRATRGQHAELEVGSTATAIINHARTSNGRLRREGAGARTHARQAVALARDKHGEGEGVAHCAAAAAAWQAADPRGRCIIACVRACVRAGMFVAANHSRSSGAAAAFLSSATEASLAATWFRRLLYSCRLLRAGNAGRGGEGGGGGLLCGRQRGCSSGSANALGGRLQRASAADATCR
jgi:hypothetical protein